MLTGLRAHKQVSGQYFKESSAERHFEFQSSGGVSSSPVEWSVVFSDTVEEVRSS